MNATPLNGSGFSPNGEELSRLISAAVISKEFRSLLLTNAESALASGYNGESFCLATEDKELVLTIQATSLSDFALQLTTNRNGKDHR